MGKFIKLIVGFLLFTFLFIGCNEHRKIIDGDSGKITKEPTLTEDNTTNIENDKVNEEEKERSTGKEATAVQQSENTDKSNEIQSEQSYLITIDEISEFINLKKLDIISGLGGKYKIIGIGAEASFEGYAFENKDIAINFENDEVNFITCGDKVDIHGANVNMNFEEIQKILGKTKVEETWYEDKSNKAYEIKYEIGNCKVVFLSFVFEENMKTSRLWIYKTDSLTNTQ